MKGIAHFAVGVAAASCIPGVVESGASGSPLYFLLGGMAGLLPDTLDFKIGRFFYRHDAHVVPDPLDLDAQLIADAVAGAFNQALLEGRRIRIKLGTVRLGSDVWQAYTVTFDVRSKRVLVAFGPRVNTGGNPIDEAPGSDGDPGIPLRKRKGVAALAGDVRLEYEAESRVDIFDGPIFEMMPVGKGMVSPVFIPWHRQWSHSLVLAAGLGLLAAAVDGAVAAGVVLSAYSAHVFLDQFGYMGSNLFHPFTRRRTAGFRWMHSGEVMGNMAAVWLSGLIVFWNLYRCGPVELADLNPLKLLFYGALVPLGIALALKRWVRWTY